MLKQEFEARVGMEISAAEYEHIEACYMVCDLSKDDFCRNWAKANESRIQQAKAEQKERDREERLRKKAWNLRQKYMHLDLVVPTESRLTEREINFCRSIGINVYNQTWMLTSQRLKRYSFNLSKVSI